LTAPRRASAVAVAGADSNTSTIADAGSSRPRRWRERRDQQKFNEMIDFARSLPQLRKVITEKPSRPIANRSR
jgi:hypothetical protein